MPVLAVTTLPPLKQGKSRLQRLQQARFSSRHDPSKRHRPRKPQHRHRPSQVTATKADSSAPQDFKAHRKPLLDTRSPLLDTGPLAITFLVRNNGDWTQDSTLIVHGSQSLTALYDTR
eukprot:1412084-Rhodomonas_salina.1